METLCEEIMKDEFCKRKVATEYWNHEAAQRNLKERLEKALQLKASENTTERLYAEFRGFYDGAHGKINLDLSIFNYNVILCEGYRAGYRLATKENKGQDLENAEINIKKISDRIDGARAHQLDWIMERP